MKINIVVAASENNVIGIGNKMPWHLPDDLKFFKSKTIGKPVLMGKNTWLSLGRPLPNRINIVISTQLQQGDLPENVLLFDTIKQGLQYLQQQACEEMSIIGGGQIYKAALSMADRVFLTRIHTVIEGGEVFFPALPSNKWERVWHEDHAADERHAFAFTFEEWVRKA
jgi:dihydrofolate reductase